MPCAAAPAVIMGFSHAWELGKLSVVSSCGSCPLLQAWPLAQRPVWSLALRAWYSLAQTLCCNPHKPQSLVYGCDGVDEYSHSSNANFKLQIRRMRMLVRSNFKRCVEATPTSPILRQANYCSLFCISATCNKKKKKRKDTSNLILKLLCGIMYTNIH